MAFEKGPYIAIAAFCENVIEDKSGVLSLIRIVDRLLITAQGPNTPEEMQPFPINWLLVISMRAGEVHGSRSIKIEPEEPSGLKLPPLVLSAHFEGANRSTNLITRVNIPLKMPGVYWFRIYVDEMFITQVPIEVIYTRIVTPPQQSQ